MTSIVSYIIGDGGAGGLSEGPGDTNFDPENLARILRSSCPGAGLFVPRDVSDRSGVGYAEFREDRKLGWDREGFSVAGAALGGTAVRRLCRLEPSGRLAYSVIRNNIGKQRGRR
jgi:hypothetical protein